MRPEKNASYKFSHEKNRNVVDTILNNIFFDRYNDRFCAPVSYVPPEAHMCICSQSFQPCPTLCNPGDCSPPGSSVHRIGQQEYRSGLAAISSSGGSSRPRGQPCISCASCIADGFFTAEPRGGEAHGITSKCSRIKALFVGLGVDVGQRAEWFLNFQGTALS